MRAVDDRLLDVLDRAHAEARRELCRWAGNGLIREQDELLCWAGANDFPAMINGALRVDRKRPGASVIERARAFFGGEAGGRGYTLFIRDDVDDALAREAVAAGLRPMGDHTPEMVLAVRPGPLELAPGLRVEPVTDAMVRADYLSVFNASYGTAYKVPSAFAEGLLPTADAFQKAPNLAGAVVYDDSTSPSRPVAAAMAIVSHGVADIHYVATVPDGGRRGYGRAATHAATAAGFDLGARVAALQASAMGKGLYARMGFVEVYRYLEFIDLSTRVKPSTQ